MPMKKHTAKGYTSVEELVHAMCGKREGDKLLMRMRVQRRNSVKTLKARLNKALWVGKGLKLTNDEVVEMVLVVRDWLEVNP